MAIPHIYLSIAFGVSRYMGLIILLGLVYKDLRLKGVSKLAFQS